jgi:para-nitrobenzyl esterase
VQRRRLDPPAGPLLAEDDGTLLHARGIRYGRAARFAAPHPLAPWSGVLDVTTRGPACLQLPSRLGWVTGPVIDGLAMSEDCQVISVTAPSDATGLPVMVWFHGVGRW